MNDKLRFTNIGEKTYYRQTEDFLEVLQRIKLHLVFTTIVIGLTFWGWFRIWILHIPILLVGVAEIFVFIKVSIRLKEKTLEKELFIFNVKLFTLYKLNDLQNYTLTEYKSGRGESGTITSYEVGLENNETEKRKEVLSFSDPENRHKLYLLMQTFLGQVKI